MQPYSCKKAEQDINFIINIIDGKDSELFVYEEDEEVLGMLIVSAMDTPKYNCIVEHRFAYIFDIVVDKNYRGKNIGSKLLNRAIDWAKEKNLDHIELSVLAENHGAHKLYSSLGFVDSSHTMKMLIEK